MKVLSETMIKNLSFPDAKVTKMEFFFEKKILKIYVTSAWLDLKEGIKLEKGVLFFNDWKSLLAKRFDPEKKTWSNVNLDSIEQLKDICEVVFSGRSVSLRGFGIKSGHWIEVDITSPKMHAEFEDNKSSF